ncbi:hypothetical protein KSD_58540 [Ktedonobacter sp. SOSP1-85]|uniref:hypothetical protein n=1 Tax=Ktedonobacter sp. SOSP1-85 TaxID=2778367 RepID=UPI0019162F0E|nr:hypothetical protein [Ktedonobacter sp. SOSP1-85]GHO78083.1 hypothetical protein KSD_58540 [Ktedonobacter sp. SOSP1-85]
MFYTLIRGLINLINGTPQRLLLHCIVAFALGTSCGVVGLGPSGFLNPLSIIFYGYALLVVIGAAFKYVAWRQQGLMDPLPNNQVLLQLDHILSVETRDRALLGARETTTQYTSQPVLFSPPLSGNRVVLVKCAVCQQEVKFRVDSVEERKKRRLRATLISSIGFLFFLGLEILLSDAFQPSPIPDWIGWIRLISLIALIGFACSYAYLVNYTGVVYIVTGRGHRARHPKKAEMANSRQNLHLTPQG